MSLHIRIWIIHRSHSLYGIWTQLRWILLHFIRLHRSGYKLCEYNTIDVKISDKSWPSWIMSVIYYIITYMQTPVLIYFIISFIWWIYLFDSLSTNLNEGVRKNIAHIHLKSNSTFYCILSTLNADLLKMINCMFKWKIHSHSIFAIYNSSYLCNLHILYTTLSFFIYIFFWGGGFRILNIS